MTTTTATKKQATKTPAKKTQSRTPAVTRERQTTTAMAPEDFSAVVLVAALEAAWRAVRTRHPEVPEVMIIIGSGTSGREAKWGHYGSMRWQHGEHQLAEVLISGEGLKRPPADVFTTLLHEAAHGLADAREVKDTSRQGRWHNAKFAAHARELGLEPHKDPRIGWSPCTLEDETAAVYRHELDALGAALQAYRHPELTLGGVKKPSNNALACVCSCPRRIRVARTVLDEGGITCDLCGDNFEALDPSDNGEGTEA